ncbi:DNA polymerase lambda [Rhynchospora pubera]|uniref:DNA polymerase n=1 Tax=Rhynchospora pubera TaxID=906938 RepID=A0AAV8HB62_9POAL|nr:DNA polymerase lambda [Rhynchospora pubera]
MAPKKRRSPSADPEGIFASMVVFLVPRGVQPRRLEVWTQKLLQMGATIEQSCLSDRLTHILAINSAALLQHLHPNHLHSFKGSLLSFQWLQNCLTSGHRLPEHPFLLNFNDTTNTSPPTHPKATDAHHNPSPSPREVKQPKTSPKHFNRDRHCHSDSDTDSEREVCHEGLNFETKPGHLLSTPPNSKVVEDAQVPASEHSSPYSPPDLNRNITQIFGKLINIYRALGDDRRSFSYYKAIPVIEKLPFKIESVDQVKHLPTIGKSLQDHIDEIVNTGKLSKLEHFENDEKVRTVSLFGEVWGIGPATALKLYEKGHRTLDDLKNDDSLTHAQRIGLQYFDDILKRIPRDEVSHMEKLLQDVGGSILPEVVIVCGGSYRRGKASCGDMDVVITHPDGVSHVGFLPKFVQALKDINFLREDLIFSVHSIEGADSGVDTYFGLCTYPGQELRHRIDFKVYPRERYAFGLIAWTGNDVLNRRLRLLAESKGYRLDDTGLYLATLGSSTKRGFKSGKIVPCKTEKDVFDELGFPWLEPHERNL